jgi:protein-tyrosine phosphatase
MLDGAVPSEAQVRDAVAWIDEQGKSGNVLVHCALGHGRTGSVVVAWLLLHGHVADAKAGVAHLVARRSTFGMSKAQAAFVERLTANRPAI